MENDFVALLEMAQEAFNDCGVELSWDDNYIEMNDTENGDSITMAMTKFRTNVEDHYGDIIPLQVIEGDAWDAFDWVQIGLIGEVVYG